MKAKKKNTFIFHNVLGVFFVMLKWVMLARYAIFINLIYDESLELALFHCGLLGVRKNSFHFPHPSSKYSVEIKAFTIDIWWSIWKVRNYFIFRKKLVSPLTIIKIAKTVFNPKSSMEVDGDAKPTICKPTFIMRMRNLLFVRMWLLPRRTLCALMVLWYFIEVFVFMQVPLVEGHVLPPRK